MGGEVRRQRFTEGSAWMGAEWAPADGGLAVVRVQDGGPLAKANAKNDAGSLDVGEVAVAAILGKGTPAEERRVLATPEALAGVLAGGPAMAVA